MSDGGQVSIHIVPAGERHVKVLFEDQGCGIPEEHISRLGEPFYTTKENGTGLGLMISYKIVQDHCGQMNIRSEPNKGTRVEIVLPLAASQSEQVVVPEHATT